jgi:hypothetical protein
MSIGGMLFEKDVNPVSRRIQRLFEGIRAAYLSAKQQPKEYTKEWMKEVDALYEDYNATDDLASALREVIQEDDIESSQVKNPESHIAEKIYEAMKELRFESEYVNDPFVKKFKKETFDKLMGDKLVLALFIHWCMRKGKNAFPMRVWEKYLPKGDEITDGYGGLDLHSKDIPLYIMEHYGEKKDTQAVKAKVKVSMTLLKDIVVENYSENEWKLLLGVEILKEEKQDIDFIVPNKPMYRIFELEDIHELKGFTGEWLVQEKYDGMRIQIHKIDNKVKIYSFNGKDITKKCPKQVEIMKEKKFGECILDAELMMFKDKTPLHRAQVVAHVFKDKELEGQLKVHVFDIMRHNDRDMTEEVLQDRIQILFQNYSVHSDEMLAFPSKKDTRIADSIKDIGNYAKEIMKIPTAEGVVIKDLTSTYIKGAKKNPKWIKWKKFVDLDLIVLDKKSTKSNMFSYTLGAGPLSIEESRKLDSMKIDDRYYLNVGKGLNTKVDVEVGSIIRVKVDEVRRNKKGQFRVYTAKIIEIPEVELPDKIVTLEFLADSKDGKSTNYKTSALTKAIIITDDIHGKAEIICKEDLEGFTVYGFKEDNLMAKNALLDMDLWKEQIGEIYKERKGKLRVGVKNFLERQSDNTGTLEEIMRFLEQNKSLLDLYNEIFDGKPKKFVEYLKNQAEDILYVSHNKFKSDDKIIEKDNSDYKTPEEYRHGKFKIYLREDENLSFTFMLNEVKLGWEIEIKSIDDIFNLFGKAGKYPAQVQTTVSKEKLIDEGDIELGVQRHGYHEYFLKGDKFDTKLHLRVIPLKNQKQWLAFTSFEDEPVEPKTDDGIWDIREDKNKELSFTTLD